MTLLIDLYRNYWAFHYLYKIYTQNIIFVHVIVYEFTQSDCEPSNEFNTIVITFKKK